jgi:hypothetical protein
MLLYIILHHGAQLGEDSIIGKSFTPPQILSTLNIPAALTQPGAVENAASGDDAAGSSVQAAPCDDAVAAARLLAAKPLHELQSFHPSNWFVLGEKLRTLQDAAKLWCGACLLDHVPQCSSLLHTAHLGFFPSINDKRAPG